MVESVVGTALIGSTTLLLLRVKPRYRVVFMAIREEREVVSGSD